MKIVFTNYKFTSQVEILYGVSVGRLLLAYQVT